MKRFYSAAMALALAASLAGLSGCGAGVSDSESSENTRSEGESVSEAQASQAAEASVSGESSENTEPSENDAESENAPIRVGSLKGPTSIGLVHLMNDENAAGEYEFTMAAAADELLASMVSGRLDIALVPANVASVLYNRTEGDISVIDINTLGVLYLISGDSSISSWQDLAGRTVYLTGKGTTPDYVLQYLLKQQAKAEGFSPDDVKLEYKSEAAEVAAILRENPDAVGLLPQPFATVAMSQNDALRIVFDMTLEWDKLQENGDGSRLVTGVTVVSGDFLEERPEAVASFLEDHSASTALANSDPAATAALVVKEDIIEKEPVAEKAIPYCSIVCIEGEEMKEALSGYLNVLYEQDPASVGGALPDSGFYYMGEQ